MKSLTKDLIILSFKRALWTMAQVMLSMITVGAALTDIDWFNIISVAAVAGIYSFLKSVVLGVPEAVKDGNIIIDDSNAESSKWYFQFPDGTDIDTLNDKKKLTFSIKKGKVEE